MAYDSDAVVAAHRVVYDLSAALDEANEDAARLAEAIVSIHPTSAGPRHRAVVYGSVLPCSVCEVLRLHDERLAP